MSDYTTSVNVKNVRHLLIATNKHFPLPEDMVLAMMYNLGQVAMAESLDRALRREHNDGDPNGGLPRGATEDAVRYSHQGKEHLAYVVAVARLLNFLEGSDDQSLFSRGEALLERRFGDGWN